MANEFIIRKGYKSLANSEVTGSLKVDGLVEGTSLKLSNGFTISENGGNYASLNSWVQVNDTGFYTTTKINMDLDDSDSIFRVRGSGNAELFKVDMSSNSGDAFFYKHIKLPTAGSQIRIGAFTNGSNNDGEYANDDLVIGDGSISIYPHRRGDYGKNESSATSTTFRSKLNIWSDNEDHITFGGANTHMVSAWEQWKIWINNDSSQAGMLQLYNKNSKVEFARLSGADDSFLLGNIQLKKLVTIGPGTTGAPYDATTFLHVKGTTRSIVQQSSTNDAYYMFGDAGANNAAWLGYLHNTGTIEIHAQSNVTIDKATTITGEISQIYDPGNTGAFQYLKNPNAGNAAYVSKKWQNNDAGFGEIWRNSSTRTSAGQGVSSFNMYNSHDINFWSGGTHTLELSGNNALFTGNITLNGNTTATEYISQNAQGQFRVQTLYGYAEMGPANTSYNHFGTDRPTNYFNKSLTVDTGVVSSYDEDLILRRTTNSNTQLTISTTQGTFSGNLAAQNLAIDGSGSFTQGVTIADVVDGPFTALRLMNQKTYGSGTGTNEKVRFVMGISESGTAFDGREGFAIDFGVAAQTDSSDGVVDFKVRDGGVLGTYQTVTGSNKSVLFTGNVRAPYIEANDPSGAANGSAQEVARFVNTRSGATSAYMYIGATSGTDWRLGKNIMGTAGNSNFGIAKHSGTALALEIDSSNNMTFGGGITMSDSILISYAGSDGMNRDAGLKIINDANDWGILVDKGNAAGNNHGIRINTDGGNAFGIYNSSNVNKVNFTGAGVATFAGNVSMPTGNSTGKFAVMSAGVHGSYDFYNNGTSYFNGNVSVDANLNITIGGGDIGLSVYTVAEATTPNVRFGRNSGEYIGFKIQDRANKIVFRQDETSGNHESHFDIWSSTSGNKAFVFKASDNAGANPVTWLTIENGDSIFTGDMTVAGTITAQEFKTELISASIIYESGSTKFGDDSTDNHAFTGSIHVDGKLGIGTGNAATLLNVNIGNGGSNGTAGLRIGGTSNYPSLELGIIGAYGGMVRSYGNDLHYYAGHWRTIGATSTENHSHYWYTSKASSTDWSNIKMELSENGNLGVGGIANDHRLYVQGRTQTSTLKVGLDTSTGNGEQIYDGYVNGDSAYLHEPKVIIRNDGSATGAIDQATLGLSIFNLNGTNSTWSKLSFASKETPSSGNTVSIAGIAAQKTAGTSGGWASGDLHLYTKAGPLHVTNMVLKSSGNVGIGTNAPSTLLQVGDPMETNTLTIAGLYSAGGARLNFRSGHPSNSTVWNMGEIKVTDDGNYNGRIEFKTTTSGGNSGASPSIKMVIKADGDVGIGTTAPFGRFQLGSHTFSGANGMHANSRVGISNHGSLTGMMLASTYNDPTYPEYGLVFVQGASTSSYNVWSISPDGPAKGTGLSFIHKPTTTNIHTGTPTMYLEGSTGNVGIGTTSPNNILHVSKAGAATILRVGNNGAHDAGVYFNTSTDWTIGTDTSNSNSFVIGNGSSVGTNPKITIETGGNVGIGTSSVDYKLHVVSSVPEVACFDTTSASYGAMNVFKAQGVIKGNAGYNAGSMYFGGEAGTNTIIQSGGRTGIFVSKTLPNKVGIGTTTPAGQLSVEGTGTAGVPTFDVINTSASTFIHSAEIMTPNMTDEQNNIVVIGRAGSTKNAGYIGWKYKGGAGSNENILTFGHWGSDNLMNLDGIGNLGLGTQTPRAKLDVLGQVYIERQGTNWNETVQGTGRGAIHLDPVGNEAAHTGNAITFGASDTSSGSTAHAGIYVRSDGTYGTKMYFSTTDSYAQGSKTALFIGADSKVGIGTTAPGVKFQVVQTAADWVGGFKNTAANGYGLRIDTSGASGTNAAFQTYTNTGTGLIIKNNGKVGIGVFTPEKALQVNTGANNYASIGNPLSNGQFAGLHFGYLENNNANYRKSAIVFERNDASFGDARGSIHLLNGPAGSGGSAALADSKFELDWKGQAYFKSSTDYKIGLNDSAGTNQWWLKSYTNGAFAIHENGVADKFVILAGGNVGIGTTVPSAKLEVYSSGSTVFEVNGSQGQLFSITDSLSGSLFSVSDISGTPLLEVESDSTVTLGDYNTNTFVVTGSLVGMGLAVPTAKLHVQDLITNGATGADLGALVRISKGASPIGKIRYDTVVIEANDVATIRIGESDGTVSSIMSGDNNMRINSTDPIKFYTNGTTTGEAHGGQGGTLALTLDNSQNATFAGTIKADNFISADATSYSLTPSNGASGYWQINTPDGNIQIGAMNTSHGHIYTDRPSFYFNKNILINGDSVLTTASSVNKLSPNGNLTTQAGTGTLIHTGQISASVTGLFAASDNSNSVITVNRHNGNYYSQLGFSSNGNLYYRKFSNTAINTTQAWKTIAFTDTTVNNATNAANADKLDNLDSTEFFRLASNNLAAGINSFSNSYNEFGNGYGSVSNDGSWNARVNVAGSSHARFDVKSVSDGIITTMYSHTGHNAGKVGTMSNHRLDFMINGTQKATLTSAARLGIGTTSPSATLAAWGANSRVTANSTADGQFIGFQAQYLDSSTLQGSFLYSTGAATLAIANHFNGNNGVYSDIYFQNCNNGSSTLQTRMTIKGSTGNVGIGTTTPSAKLEVYGSGSTVLDIQGSQGQLFSITDDLTGDLLNISDISGIPIFSVNASGTSSFDGDVEISGKIKEIRVGDNHFIGNDADDNLLITSSINENLILRAGVGMRFEVDGNASPADLALNIDNAKTSTFGGYVKIPQYLMHDGDTNTRLEFTTGNVVLKAATKITMDGPVSAGQGITITGNADISSNLSVNGNTALGNGNGDTTHINDILHIGATDSGNSDLYFGEGAKNAIAYGVHWNWDSGYKFSWFTRNASSDTLLMDYATNVTSVVNWHRPFDMKNNKLTGVANPTSAGDATTKAYVDGAHDRIGNCQFAATSTGTSYSTAAIELRESNLSGSGGTAPYIGFHHGGVVASSIAIESSGRIAIRNNPGNAYEALIASTVTATKFAGQTMMLNWKAFHNTTAIRTLYKDGHTQHFPWAYSNIIMPFKGCLTTISLGHNPFGSYTAGPTGNSAIMRVYVNGTLKSTVTVSNYGSTAGQVREFDFGTNASFNKNDKVSIRFQSNGLWRYITLGILFRETA